MIRRLACFALSFSAGIFLAQYLLPLRLQPLFAAAFALAALLGFTQRDRKRRLRLLLAGFGLAAALCWNMGYTALTQTPARLWADRVLESGEATVLRYAEDRTNDGWGQNRRWRIRVRLHTENGAHTAYLYAGEELLALEPGNVIRAPMQTADAAYINGEPISSFTSRGAFLLLYPKGELTVERGSAGSLRWLPQRVGHLTGETIARLYGGETAALVRAVLTGDKEGFGDELYAVLSEAGILHVAAVSGLHCAFLLSMVRLLLGRRRGLTALVGLPLLLFYALLVGAPPSVLRSVVMMAFLLLAPLIRRENDRLTTFSAALMLVLALNPFAAASISLQLSFGAVAGMMWLTPRLYAFLCGKEKKESRGVWRKLRRFLAASLSATLGALVFTTPLSAWYFNNLVLISPLTNILLLTAVNALFCLSLLSLALGLLFPPAGAAAALPVKGLAAYILFVSRKAAALPFHAVYFDEPYLALWLGFAYLLLGLCVVKKTPRRGGLLALGCAVLALLAAAGLTRLDRRYGEMDIVALDVGQGQSVIVASGGETLLIDCGTSNGHISAGDIAGDQLLGMGGDTLDYLVLTHYHTDHTDGLPALLTRIRVRTLLCPPPQAGDETAAAVMALMERYDVAVETVTEDRSYAFGGGTLRVLAPLEGLDSDDENENGLVVLCTVGDFDFLATGDMGEGAEKQLLRQKQLPDIELMMVGHHGSNGSSCEELLAAVKPETGIISVGDNSYGHPAEGAMKRFARMGVELYRTDQQGSIFVTVR